MVGAFEVVFGLRVAVFVLAGFLLFKMYRFTSSSKSALYSRALGALILAVSLFLIVELMQMFGLIISDIFDIMRLIMMIAFLILLLYALESMRKDALAVDHLMHRRNISRHRTHDLE
jgi:hypothetical protein